MKFKQALLGALFCCLIAVSALAQGLVPNARQVFIDANGLPLVGGTVQFYIPGTTTPKNTWADAALTQLNTNPITLDAFGSASIYGQGQYREIVTSSLGSLIWDSITQAPSFSTSFSVATNAALLASCVGTSGCPSGDPVYSTGVWRQDYASGIGSPTIFYSPSNLACPLNGGNGDNGSQVKSADGKCWLANLKGIQPNPTIWGAYGDGVHDDTTAISNALAASGGILWQGYRSYYIGSNLTIPNATVFKGPYQNIGAVQYHSPGSGYNYNLFPALLLSSSATITTSNASGLDGVLLYRNGMTFPAANTSGFSGTAITVAGDTPILKNSLIMGFNQAFTSNGYDKGLIENVNFDNQGNIYINNANDTWKITNVHAWPFATETPTSTSQSFFRSGVNFEFDNSTDAADITNYVSFGYATGFKWINPGAATCTNCDADYDIGISTPGTGFYVGGSNANARLTLVNPQSYSQGIGFDIAHTGGTTDVVKIQGGTVSGTSVAAIKVESTAAGTLLVNDLYNTSNLLAGEIDSANELVYFGAGNDITNTTSMVQIHVPVATNNVFLGKDNIWGDAIAEAGKTTVTYNVTVPTISVTTGALNLPPIGDTFLVSDGGTAAIINGEWAARRVTLIFAGTTTIQNNSGGSFGTVNLAGSANFTSTVNSTLTLTSTGGNTGWYEVSRQLH